MAMTTISIIMTQYITRFLTGAKFVEDGLISPMDITLILKDLAIDFPGLVGAHFS